MKYALKYIQLLLLMLFIGMGFVACSSDEADTVEYVRNPIFKLEVVVDNSGGRHTRSGATPGTFTDESEYAVHDATVFVYQAKDGINGNADTPILYKVYVSKFKKTSGDGTSNVVYTSPLIKTQLAIPTGNYRVLAVCNMGNLSDKVKTLGDLRSMTTETLALGELSQPGHCSYMAMTSASDDEVKVTGEAGNGAPEPDASLISATINVQRLAARLDFSPGKGEWVENQPLTLTGADARKVTISGYKYQVGTTNDVYYLTNVTPVNLYKGPEYVLKRVTEDNTFDIFKYLGKETTGVDGNATNYVVDPNTQQKGAKDLTALYTPSYDNTVTLAPGDANLSAVTQVEETLDGCYKDRISTTDYVFRKLTYARENTIVMGTSKQKYATGLLFTGYYVKNANEAGARAVNKTFEYFIRHVDPNNSNSDALIMKYGIVRNHVYQVAISGVSSLGIILIEVRSWIPKEAPDIYL